jgi:hypothetical protein
MMRLDFRTAELWNRFGPRLFVFYSGQWILRIVFLLSSFLFRSSEKKILAIDIALSAASFLIGYLPLIKTLAGF